eukprot:15440469-Alexandrium_andersonii.AAC.1
MEKREQVSLRLSLRQLCAPEGLAKHLAFRTTLVACPSDCEHSSRNSCSATSSGGLRLCCCVGTNFNGWLMACPACAKWPLNWSA